MANRDPSNDAHEARMPASPEAADATAQPGDQTSSSAEEVVPLFEIIDTCLEELPALREFMPPQRARTCRACLMSDDGEYYQAISPEESDFLLDNLFRVVESKHAVLILEDIDAGCFQALATHFPASLDVRFLAQHVLRLGDLKATYDLHDSLRNEYRTLVSRVDAEISRRLSGTTVNRDPHCRHIDGQVARNGINARPVRGILPGDYEYRWEKFSNLGDSQRVRKTSTRLSFCRVHKNLALCLVDAGPESVGTLQFGSRDLWPADASGNVEPMDFVWILFRRYTVSSVLAPPVVDHVTLMLSTAAYQALVPNLEVEFLKRRQIAVQSDNELAFSMLTDFRRGLTSIHQSMANTSNSVVLIWSATYSNQGKKSSAQHMQMSAEDTMVGSTSKEAAPGLSSATGLRQREPADLRKLSETFSELDVRLRAIIAALNDDIQIVIGSVQIQDAKAMKLQTDLTMELTKTTMHQTKVSIRQTRWTVVLAVVAALYLPMTLVTGIYGMNIKEISGDKGPNWWWVVVTWAVTMAITVGSVGRYALVEWRWYQEVMQETEAAAKRDPPEDISRDKDHGRVDSTSGEAEDTGCLSTARRRHLWWKLPQNSQHNVTRSTV